MFRFILLFTSLFLLFVIAGCSVDDDTLAPNEENEPEVTGLPTFSHFRSFEGFNAAGYAVAVNPSDSLIYVAATKYDETRSEIDLFLGKFTPEGEQLDGDFYSTQNLDRVVDIKIGGDGHVYTLVNVALSSGILGGTKYSYVLSKFKLENFDLVWSKSGVQDATSPNQVTNKGVALVIDKTNDLTSKIIVFSNVVDEGFFDGPSAFTKYNLNGNAEIRDREIPFIKNARNLIPFRNNFLASGTDYISSSDASTKASIIDGEGNPIWNASCNDILFGICIPTSTSNEILIIGEEPDNSNAISGKYIDRSGSTSALPFSPQGIVFPLDGIESYVLVKRVNSSTIKMSLYDNGALMWENDYSVPNASTYVRNIVRHPDGGIVAVGSASNDFPMADQLWLLKTDQFGQVSL